MSYTNVQNLEHELIPAGATGEELAVDAAVVSPSSLAASVTHAMVSVKTAAVLATLDGEDPDNATQAGLHLAVGDRLVLHRTTVQAMKLVEQTAGSAGVVRIEPMTLA